MEPHPVLERHYDHPTDKQKFLRGLFDRTAPYYEGINRWGFFGSGAWYRREALKRAGLQPGMRVLDVAAGTGPTARAVATVVGSTGRIVCLDNSHGMLRECQQSVSAQPVQAVADQLPVRDAAFDFLTMGFALRHVANLEATFREYHRVLRVGGKAVILDTIKPTNRCGQAFARVYFRDVLPWFARRTTGNDEAGLLIRYYWETMDQMVPSATVREALTRGGFVDVQCRVFFGTFIEYEARKGS